MGAPQDVVEVSRPVETCVFTNASSNSRVLILKRYQRVGDIETFPLCGTRPFLAQDTKFQIAMDDL